MYLFHNSRNKRFRSPFGAAPVNTSIQLGLEVTDIKPTAVYVRLWHGEEQLIPMTLTEDSFYSTVITLPATPCLCWYYFIIESGEDVLFYGRPGESQQGTGMIMEQPESWQITVYIPTQLPEWYRKSVVYQIFPDRFARGQDFNTNQIRAAHPEGWRGTSRLVMQNWYDHPFYCRDLKNRVTGWPFFGGSLQGIIEKLPYLKAMNIGAIYLNPIFLASSNHKYDTADYMQLDPTFGTEEDFTELCQKAKEAGIRIILDGVFSHTGDDSIYFNRYGNFPEPGAYGDTPSAYDSWYRFGSEHPCGWESWWGVDSLPNVEETDPGYQEYITGKNGVIQKWLSLGASGWRLDVADELPDSFIEKIRTAGKAVREDALLLGEVWEDASNKQSYQLLRNYLLGSELDCTMHYPFRKGALDFLLGRSSARTFADALSTILENYPRTAQQGALNLIGTHDTPRILNILGEAPDGLTIPEQEYYRLSQEQLHKARMRLKLLQVLQFSVPGVPCIYYGDEAGMQGYADPFNRGTFPWGKEDGDLQYHVRMLSCLRKEYPVFIEGDTQYLAPSADVFGIRRQYEDTVLYVFGNRSDRTATLRLSELDGSWLELSGGKPFAGPELSLPPYGYVMLLQTADTYQPLKNAVLPMGSGVLCPLFSLPENEPGQLMHSTADEFLDTLVTIGAKNWMLLPLNPAGEGNSPYSSRCLFAGDTRYSLNSTEIDPDAYQLWYNENSDWVENYALYTILREKYDRAWQEWPKTVRDRKNLPLLQRKYANEIASICQDQYRFAVQWSELHKRATARGIQLIGDLPIYAALDSADTWANRELFQLDENGYPSLRAGCPPDYFNQEGQDWGNPLYNWELMQKDHFSWWRKRIRRALNAYDFIRLDHFRAFSSYYAIPSGASAKNGVWMKGPGLAFFKELAAEFSRLPIIAEDLGSLDSMVTLLLTETGLPGMNVWQFSPQEMRSMSNEEASKRVFFSGTHDNQTLFGFLSSEKSMLNPEDILESISRSPAAAYIIPVQDLLSLGDEARINVPGIPKGNWTWRMTPEMLHDLKAVTLFHK